MKKNNKAPKYIKPLQVRGVLATAERSGPYTSIYDNAPKYYIHSISLEGDDKKYNFEDSAKNFRYEIGDSLYFRAVDQGNILYKSLGKSIPIPDVSIKDKAKVTDDNVAELIALIESKKKTIKNKNLYK
jgi:hypothetical protein